MLKTIIKPFRILIKFIIWFPIIFISSLLFPSLFKVLFQNKHYRLVEEITDNDNSDIQNTWLTFANKFKVYDEYLDDFIESLEYFSQFDKNIMFDSQKNNPMYTKVHYILHIISLAKEAVEHLDKVTKDNKKVSYYEENKNASLDDLIKLYFDKLNAKNEHKISTIAAKNEIRLRKFMVKLKKHDPLFINFYLMFYTIYPISNFNFKEDENNTLEFVQDLYEFFQLGHATKPQIYKSVAIQIYKLYEDNISKIKSSSKTTQDELKEQIARLINLTLHTEKDYRNFNNFDQEPYIKNIVYNFPIFECDNKLAEKQTRRFKFYFIGKNMIVPKYIPKFFRKFVLNKLIKTPLSFYRSNGITSLFGLFQKKI